MDWGKIAIANAINPGLGVMEYEKQRKKKHRSLMKLNLNFVQ